MNDIKVAISKVDKKTENKIVGLVDEILKIKNRNANEDTVEIEREIYGIVWLKPAVGVNCMV